MAKATFYKGFPTSCDAAERRCDSSLKKDPYPNIEASLLNSADIEDYARQVGLIYEFDKKNLKPSSYAAHIGSKIFYWDPELEAENEEFEYDLSKGEVFKIKPLGLVYIVTQEEFFLPHYIAARFNLQIEFIHRGLLLGTGPLVDPGFKGPLLIPLHNLTQNTYELAQGQQIIWIEFTKTSPNTMWQAPKSTDQYKNRSGSFVPLPEAKRVRAEDPVNYLNIARMDRNRRKHKYPKLVSAIPSAVADARKLAEEAKSASTVAASEAKVIKNWAGAIGVVGLIGTMLLIVQIYQELQALHVDAKVRWGRTEKELGYVKSTIDKFNPLNLQSRLDGMRSDLDTLNKRRENMDKQILELKAMIDGLRTREEIEKMPNNQN